MKILVVCGFQPYWGKHLPPNVLDLEDGPTMGGGEEAAVRGAAGLRALGHDVTLHWYGQEGVWRGVQFHNEGLYSLVVGSAWDVVISFSDLRALEWARGAKRLFAQQLNDLNNIGLWNSVDGIISPSRSHAEQLPRWGWRNRPYAVVHNGLDADTYLSGRVAFHDRPFDVGYWSSPDRGLHHLLRAWPFVTKRCPTAKLHVFYEIDRYLSFAVKALGPYGERARLLDELIVQAKTDKSVIFHGAVPRKKLAKIQKQCRVQCYPYDPVDYCEGFCGSVNQGIASGALVMTTPKDALPSLYEDRVYWLDDDLIEPGADMERLAEGVFQGLMGALPHQFDILERAANPNRWYTWGFAALELERACTTPIHDWARTRWSP